MIDTGSQIIRLRLTSTPESRSTEAQLSEIELLSSLKLPITFRELWLTVGGASVNGYLVRGDYIERVATFWPAHRILDELNEGQDGRVVPFGDDYFGNWYYLQGENDESVTVRLVDWDKDTTTTVATSFEEFVRSLRISSGEEFIGGAGSV